MRTADDPIDWNPQRIAVAGLSGSGKTTLCEQLAALLRYPRAELDGLYHGPGWTRRETFVEEVRAFVAGPRWVTELQHREVRPLIVARADTLLWLDYPAPVHMTRLVRRTVRRRMRREELWNSNQEQPLHRLLVDRDHIIRWGWRTRKKLKLVIPTLEGRFPGLTVVRLNRPPQTARWVRRLASALEHGEDA